MPVFKYGSLARLDVIESGQIRYTPPRYLNDPFELRPHFPSLMPEHEFEREILQRWPETIRRNWEALPPALRSQFPLEEAIAAPLVDRSRFIEMMHRVSAREAVGSRDRLYDWLNMKVGILSLGGTQTSVLMWSHYGDGHRGLVFEFDDSHAYFHGGHAANPRFNRLLRVEYRVDRPEMFPSDLDQLALFLVKARYWGYEQETRIIRPLEEAIEVRHVDGQPIHLFDFPPVSLRAVYCGALVPLPDRVRVAQAVRDDPRYAHVALRCIRVREAQFALESTEIDV